MLFDEIRKDDPLRDLKEEANRQHKAALEATRRWREEHPNEWTAWFEDLKARNREAVIQGARNGWWELDSDGNMLAPPVVIDSTKLPAEATMAHVMAKAGLFPSISQARKNGWDKPLTKGVFTVTKKKIRIKVV